MRSSKTVLSIICISLAAGICRPEPAPADQAAQEKVVIVGSGSYLPVRLYQVWVREFNRSNPGIQVQYLPLGSSESMIQISQGIGDFGSGEVPLAQAQSRGSRISLIEIPTAVVGIVPIYNLPGDPELSFSGELLAQIYLGTVRDWNDSRIARLNPNVQLPELPIRVVHRSSGKGSNYIFTEFLSKTSPEFRARVGTSASPGWPVGVEADRSQDMVRRVELTRGAIGYVELSFIGNSRLGRGRVQNPAGRFVLPTAAAIEAACAAMENVSPGNLQMDLINAPGKDSYPIVSFTWLYVPRSGPSPRRRALKQFLSWSLQDGQAMVRSLGFIPLPDRIAAKALAVVNSAK